MEVSDRTLAVLRSIEANLGDHPEASGQQRLYGLVASTQLCCNVIRTGSASPISWPAWSSA